MKKKIIVCLIIIIVVVIVIKINKKEEVKISNISQLDYYSIRFDEYDEYNNLRFLCYSENEEDICNLYDKTVSNTSPIETIKSKDNEYLPNYIHYGDFDLEEDYSFKVNDSLARNIDFINDFYSIYTKNGEKYERNIKIHGKNAIEYKNEDEYVIYKEENNSNYFLVPKNVVEYFSSLIINDNNAACIYVKENKKYVYPKVIIYNYKNGEIIKEYNFDRLKNIYSYEDSPIGYNENEKLFIINDKNYYLNLDNFKELILNDASFEYDKILINKNKVYDYKLNLIKEFNNDEKPIFIRTIDDIYETAYILYEKDNIIYNLDNKVVYELEKGEKYYPSEDILILYNDKYITKAIDINGKILFDNNDNKLDLKVSNKNKLDYLDIDKNGNLITYNEEVSKVRCLRNNKNVDYNVQIEDMYIRENILEDKVKIDLYDKNLNSINTFELKSDEKINRVDYLLLNTKYIKIELVIGDDEQYNYSINYLYDIKNNRLLDDVIYSNNNYNYVELKNDNIIIFGGSKDNMKEYLYYINDNVNRLNNDLNIDSIFSYNNDEILFEVENQKYIVIPNKVFIK